MKDLNTLQGMTALPAHVEQAKTLDYVKSIQRVCTYAVLAMLSAYAVQLMNSAGDIGVQEKNLIVVASALTLLVVVPIVGLSIYVVSRGHASSTSAKNSPRSSHSIKNEAVAWALPIVTVAVLALLGLGMTHSLDLYKPIASKVAPERVASVASA